MKLSRIIAWCFCAVATTSYLACNKQESPSGPTIDPIVSVNATVSGRITDKDQLPVSGATVKMGSNMTQSDLNGFFNFGKTTVINANAANVTVAKTGFFSGSRTIKLRSEGSGYVSIQLIKKDPIGSFSSTAGGTVTLPGNTGSIQFPVSGVVTAGSNTVYSGLVSVSAFLINPTDPNFQEMMPGNLQGIDAVNRQTGMQSFGMMAVELTGSAGEALQLANGKPAVISLPIPSGLQAQAPASIPMWHFNDTTGLWKEEGAATRQGNNYVGPVAHFSFWNCDIPVPFVDFQAKVQDQAGLPIVNFKVVLKVVNDLMSSSGFGYTDNAGIISGSLPSGKNLQLVVYDKCNKAILTKNVGPFTNTADLGIIMVTDSSRSMVMFSGTVINCDGLPLANGFVDVQIENAHTYVSVTDGTFRQSLSRCNRNNANAVVTAYDLSKNVHGDAKTVTMSDTAANTGLLTSCGTTTEQYLIYTVDGKSYSFLVGTDTMFFSQTSVPSNFLLSAYRKSFRGESFSLQFKATTTGPASQIVIAIVVDNSGSTLRTRTPSTLNISLLEGAGGFVAGEFAATVSRDTSSSSKQYPVSGRFKMKSRN